MRRERWGRGQGDGGNALPRIELALRAHDGYGGGNLVGGHLNGFTGAASSQQEVDRCGRTHFDRYAFFHVFLEASGVNLQGVLAGQKTSERVSPGATGNGVGGDRSLLVGDCDLGVRYNRSARIRDRSGDAGAGLAECCAGRQGNQK